MGDIPDWLVELAAQRDEEDDEADETEWDILRADDTEEPAAGSAEADVPVEASPEVVERDAAMDTANLDEGALIDVLRSQVETEEEAADVVSATSRKGIGLLIPGLLPWQQLVLAALLLLDIIVIGLLFLVMLGRMTIG